MLDIKSEENATDDMMYEEDEVIRELDVFVNNENLLYLGQFPLRPVYAEPVPIQGVRYKPKHHKIELSTPYPPAIQKIIQKNESSSSSSLYSGRNNSNENITQKLISSELQQSNPLMVGFIQNNQFFLSTVDKVVQFKPVMNQQHANIKVEYLESDGEYEAMNEEEVGPDSTAGGTSSTGDVKQIQLKRKESERAQNARLQSYSYLKQQEELEPWIHLKPFPIGSNQSDEKFLQISSIAPQK